MDKQKRSLQGSLTIDQASVTYGVSRRTIERLRAKGSLPGIRVGRFLRIQTGDIERVLAVQNPEQLYRRQLHPSASTDLSQWLIGWGNLVRLNFSNAPDRKAATRWASAIAKANKGLPIEELRVGEALRRVTNLKTTPNLSLLADLLRGIDPDLPIIQVARQLLPLLVPKI